VSVINSIKQNTIQIVEPGAILHSHRELSTVNDRKKQEKVC